MPRRVLLLLSQSPRDPTSGAARSMRSIAEMLAAAGFQVSALATTATDQPLDVDPIVFLQRQGLAPSVQRPSRFESRGAVLRYTDDGVRTTLLHTGMAAPMSWAMQPCPAFDELLDHELKEHPPDILFTFGGADHEIARRVRVRQRGTAVVFGLRNHGYYDRRAFDGVDAVLTPSRFLSNCYARALGLVSTPIPTPIRERTVLADPGARKPRFLTFVNPTPRKGVMLFARIAEELGSRRPDIPMLVVESRGSAGALVQAGLRAGFDLRRHASIQVSPGVAEPRHIYIFARALLVPSVWQEPSGRVAAEAMLNSVPVIVSDRGGLPETVGEGGAVLSLPDGLTELTDTPVSREEARPWIEAVVRLWDSEAFEQDAIERAGREGARYREAVIAARYVEFFSRVQRVNRPS